MAQKRTPLLTLAVALAMAQGCRSAGTPAIVNDPERPEAPTAPSPEVEGAPALTGEAALSRATALSEAAKVRSAYAVDEAAAARAVEAGLTESEAVALVEALLADCLAIQGRCESLHPLSKVRREPPIPQAGVLVALLGELATPRSLPIFFRLEARGFWEAGRGLELHFERLSRQARATEVCHPPTPEQVAQARAALGDFVVIETRRGALVSRAPTEAEREDLAYLLSAVAGAGPAVGTSEEGGEGSFARPGAPDEQRQEIYEQLEAAQLSGDLAAIAQRARALLESLGYPGPISTERVSEYTWGGARYSYVMRDLAVADEALGQLEEAEALYRRANPGGGACGTSVSTRWAEQVRGVIRTAERQGHCGAVVAERLIGVDGAEPNDYGPTALTEAGYDVARLYRGALVTINRDAERDQLEAALRAAPRQLREAALARLERLGAEGWEGRVHALEGLADVAQRQAIDRLIAAIEGGTPSVKVRALGALSQLTERPDPDPCDPSAGYGLGSGSSEWSRQIRRLGRSCETKLPLIEAETLATRLLPLLRRREPEVRQAAAEALGALGTQVALAPLRALANDPYQLEGTQICETPSGGGEQQCRVPWPVREAAAAAVERIVGFERRRAEANAQRQPSATTR